MAAHHQNDNATMLSIEALYQQSEIIRTVKVSQPDSRPSVKRRQRFTLPLINSKPLDSFLSSTASDTELPKELEGLVLSGLKYPAIEQDSALPKSLNLAHVRTAISQHTDQQITPEILKGTQSEAKQDPQDDPISAIRQAVMTAADTQMQPASQDRMLAGKSGVQQDLHMLVTKLVTLIEDEVEDRLAKQQSMPVANHPAPKQKQPEKQASTAPKKSPKTPKKRTASARAKKDSK